LVGRILDAETTYTLSRLRVLERIPGNPIGVDVICGGAEFLSTSHRNMERAGMRVLFIRSIWTAR